MNDTLIVTEAVSAPKALLQAFNLAFSGRTQSPHEPRGEDIITDRSFVVADGPFAAGSDGSIPSEP